MTTERPYDLASQEFYRRSNTILAQMREANPVYMETSPYGNRMWYITRYEDVEAVLRDNEHFAMDYRAAFDPETLAKFPQEPTVMEMVNNHLLTKDGEDHRRLRGLVTQAFTPRRIAAMRPRIQEIADELLEGVQAAGEAGRVFDLVERYAFPLPITVIAELLGIPVEDREPFRGWSDAFVTGALTADDERFYESAMGFVLYLGNLFEQRRQDPRDDLISALLQAEQAGDRLKTEELFSMVVLLIIAGHETTVSLIGNAAVILMTNPEAATRLRAHPAEMPQAVEEFLRYESPVQRALSRWVKADVVIGGQAIKRGDMVVPVLGAANRDPRAFDRPDSLDIGREHLNTHLAFGKGAHYCLGAPLARLEGEIAMNTLLRRMPNLRLAVPLEELPYRETPLFHAFQKIPVTW
jgi:cytochrome P450